MTVYEFIQDLGDGKGTGLISWSAGRGKGLQRSTRW